MKHLSDIVFAAPLLGPFGLAVIALLVPRAAGAASVAGALAPLAAGVVAAASIGGGVPLRYQVGGWPAPLGIELRADGLAAMFLMVLGVVGGVVAVWSWIERPRARDGWSSALFLFCLGALGALAVTADAFHAYVAFEMVNVAAVALIAVKGSREAVGAALRYLLIAIAGGLVYVAGLTFVYAATAELDFARMGAAGAGTVYAFGGGLMVAGLLVKAALVPLHGWLPAAHSSATAPVSALLSALVVKGPILVLIRVQVEVLPPGLASDVAGLVGALGAAAIFWGGVQALRATEVKRLVAYSTVAQIGFIFVAFAIAPSPRELAAIVGVLMVSHAIAKAALFLGAGGLLEAAESGHVAHVTAAAARRPVAAGAIAVALVSLVGLPPSLGFVGKWGLLGASVASGSAWAFVAVAAGTLLSAAYGFKLIRQLMGEAPRPDERPTLGEAARDLTALALAAVALVLGLAATPIVDLLSLDLATTAGAVEGAP